MATKLDANQVLKRSFDDSNDRIRVDAEVTATLGTVEVIISHVNDSIRIGDGTDLVNVTPAGEMNVISTAQPGVDIGDITVNNTSGAGAVNIQDGGNSITVDGTISANQSGIWNITDINGTINLPTGAATSANQASQQTSLNNLDSKIPSNLTVSSTRLLVDNSGVTQPISAVSLPLPTGASTAANQTTSNTTLSSIETKLTDKSQFTKLTDGTDTALINSAGELLVVSNPAAVSTSSLTSVTVTTSSTSLLSSNSNRKRFYIFNDSGAIIFVAFSATASTTSFTFTLANKAFYDSDGGVIYTGAISAIRGAGSGSVRITELT